MSTNAHALLYTPEKTGLCKQKQKFSISHVQLSFHFVYISPMPGSPRCMHRELEKKEKNNNDDFVEVIQRNMKKKVTRKEEWFPPHLLWRKERTELVANGRRFVVARLGSRLPPIMQGYILFGLRRRKAFTRLFVFFSSTCSESANAQNAGV